jgi:hypothetical protein
MHIYEIHTLCLADCKLTDAHSASVGRVYVAKAKMKQKIEWLIVGFLITTLLIIFWYEQGRI